MSPLWGRLAEIAAAIAAVALTSVGGSSGAPTTVFRAVDLGTLGGGFSEAAAISNGGQVVGSSETAAGCCDDHAFSWTRAGGMVDLGTLGGASSDATAVTETGQVVGYSLTATNDFRRAFSWTQAGGMIPLGTLGGSTSVARDVNDSGQVVGESTTAGGAIHAFSWTQAGGMVDLGTLGGGFSEATAVNANGQVVGSSTTAGGVSHAFSWTRAGGMVDLGTLGGLFSYARAVSDVGQVVGASDTATSNFRGHLFSWTANGGMADLGALDYETDLVGADVNDAGRVVSTRVVTTPRGENVFHRAVSWTSTSGMVELGALGFQFGGSVATAVNEGGQVVGTVEVFLPLLERYAFSWTESGGMVALPSPGRGLFAAANAVNDAGEIAGIADAANGQNHATLWLAADVPSAPGDVTAEAGDRQATVSFAPPLSDGGLPVRHYTVTSFPGGRSAHGTGSGITVGGLTNGTSYTFTVAAANDAGTGSPSPASAAVVPLGPERVHPEPPSELPRAAVPDLPPGEPRPRPPVPSGTLLRRAL